MFVGRRMAMKINPLHGCRFAPPRSYQRPLTSRPASVTRETNPPKPAITGGFPHVQIRRCNHSNGFIRRSKLLVSSCPRRVHSLGNSLASWDLRPSDVWLLDLVRIREQGVARCNRAL